jgi:S-(hydroxymethyl)glutathione dehydrogenase/alcohol dehydrogenase
MSTTRITGAVFRGPRLALHLEELRLDDPAPGEVRLRMVATGVCHSDLHVVDGDWVRPTHVVLGHEGAGVIEALGEGVAERSPDVPAGMAPGHRVGDLVVLAWTAPCGACVACGRGEAWLCATPRGGGHRLAPDLVRLRRPDGEPIGVYSGVGTHATGQVVDAAAAIPVDPRTPPEVAALIGCAATTGVGAVRTTAGVRAGETVVVIGLGGVGLAALMAAVDAGASVIAVDREAAKLTLAADLGADLAIGPGPDLVAQVCRATDGGADHAFECIGLTETAELAVDLVRPGGAVTLVGMTLQGARAGIDVYRFVEDGKRLLGSNYGSAIPARDFPAIAADVVAGRLPLERLVTDRIGLEDLGAALDAMRRRDGARRVVIFPGA